MKTKEVIKTYFANKTVVKWTTMKKFFDLYPNIKKLADYIFKRNKNWESSTNVILGIARNEYLPYCKYCHKQLTYTHRKSQYCSTKCLNKDPETQAKIKATKLQKYGSETYNNSEQRKETCLEIYGFENAAKNENVKNKTKETCLERYNKEYTTQTDIMKEKSRLTKLARYNNKNYVNSEKSNKTRLLKQYKKFLLDPDIMPLFSEDKYEGVIYYDKLYKWECKHCHNQFYASCYTGIPKCKICNASLNGTSLLEHNLIDFCKEHFSNIITNDKKLIAPYELDIVIPEIKLAIEFNGNYWHSVELKEKNYHLNKVNLCNKLGYRLIHIWENEWINNQDEIKEKLKLVFLNTEYFYKNFILLDNSWYNNIENKLINFKKLDIINPINILRDKHRVENCGFTLYQRCDSPIYLNSITLKLVKDKIYAKYNIKDIEHLVNTKFEIYPCQSINDLKLAAKHLSNLNGNTITNFLKKQPEIKQFVENIFNSNPKKYCTINKTFIALVKDIQFGYCKCCGKELNYDQVWNNATYCSNKCKLSITENPFSRHK